jgi:amidohydrolase
MTPPAGLRSMIASMHGALTAFRHDLHAHPELSFAEHRTSRRVAEELARLGIEHRTGLAGGTGVLGYLPATEPATDSGSGPAVALRADMDALPITEATGRPYASTTPGVMHACGHDGHTAMLLGAAGVLSQLEHRPHPVLLLFQPAEESGGGAEHMVRDGVLSGRVLGPAADRVFGLHGWPTLPLGVLATRPGPMLASTDEFLITIKGVGGHAAMPHLCKDPIVAASAVVMALQTVVSRNCGPLEQAVCTVGRFTGGTVDNIIPEAVELEGTTRALLPEVRERLERRVKEIARFTAEAHGCEADIRWNRGYPVTRNDESLTAQTVGALREVMGQERVIIAEHPVMGGEDFSYYGTHARACFLFLGLRPGSPSSSQSVSESWPGLHTPRFDFHDAAIPVGVEALCTLALR